MIKPIHVLGVVLTLLAYSIPTFSQQKIDVKLNEKPIIELFNMIEANSEYRIFCDPQEMDTIIVSIDVSQMKPLDIVKKALENTSFKATEFNNSIFILKDKALATTVSTPSRDKEAGYTSADSSYKSNFLVEQKQKDHKATSEFKVYTVGNESLMKSGKKVNLSGYIIDSKTGEPIPGVTVWVENRNEATMSDAYGYYLLSLEPGSYNINIQGGGQEKSKWQIKLYSEGRLDIQSIEKVHTLKEVVVQGDLKDNIRQTTIGVERLKMQEVKNIPTAFGEADILRIVMSLPGVKSVGEVSSGFNVRGGATDQNLILYNDATIYNPTHLFGLFSAFNPDVVRDMELYKSSIPSKYGGRISSVLDINSREGNKKEFTGAASLGLVTSRATVEGPIVKDKGSFLVGARTTYSDWLLKQLPEKSGYQDGNAGFYDLNANISHNFDPRNSLYISGYFSQDRFKFEKTESYKYRNANASIKWRHVFTPKVTGVVTMGYDHYDHKTENIADSAQHYSLKFNINQMYGKADFNWYPSINHSINFGFNTLLYKLEPGIFNPIGEESLIKPDRIQKEKALESALYIGYVWDITSSLSVDLGVRYSMFNVLGPRTYNLYASGLLPSLSTIVETKENQKGSLKTYQGPEFRASVRYAFSDDFSIKAGVNSMRQYIHKISNSSVMTPTDTWKLTDMNIKPQKGIQYAFGIYKNFANSALETSIEAYYKTIDDYLDYRSGAQLLMNHHLETDVLSTEGRAYGIELMLRKTRGKLNGWVSYAYARTELKQSDKRLALPVNDGNWYPADFDKPHEFKFIGNYKFTHRYSLSLNCEYATGRPITLPVSKYKYVGGQYVYYAERNKYRIPDYFRVDVGFNIEPSHNLKLLTHSTITLGVYNLTGRKNAHSIYYKYDKGRIQGYKLSVFGVPIPYVSYNIKF